MNAKRFFYVAAGILLLVIAYSIGAHQADAQSGSSQFVGISVDPQNSATTAITSSGDIYARGDNPYCDSQHMQWGGQEGSCGWTYMGNVLGGAIAVQSKSMSDVKGAYRGK
jgi:hypothetical protein